MFFEVELSVNYYPLEAFQNLSSQLNNQLTKDLSLCQNWREIDTYFGLLSFRFYKNI